MGTAISAAMPTCSKVPINACHNPPPSRSGETLRIVVVTNSGEKAFKPRIATEVRIQIRAPSAIRNAVQMTVVASRSVAKRRPSTA